MPSTDPAPPCNGQRSTARLVARVAWVVIQLCLVLWLSRRGVQFYYQGF